MFVVLVSFRIGTLVLTRKGEASRNLGVFPLFEFLV